MRKTQSETMAGATQNQQRVKVAVTGLRGLPGIMGGVETHCEELLPRLVVLDPSVDITVLARSPYMSSANSQFQNIQVVALPAPKSQSIEAIVSTLNGILYARRQGFSMIHIHAVGPALLAPLARLLGMQVVMTHHGADYNRAKWGRFARFALRVGEHVGVMCANRIICVSPSLTREMQQRFPKRAARFRYIPNGAPQMGSTDQSSADILSSLGLEPKGFLLAVGRLVPEKGLDYLIDAVRQSGCDLPLAIVGASDHGGDYVRALMGQADSQIRFLGLQSRAVLRHLYENAALFILPSFHEGLPIVALEAAQSQAPMLLSDIQPNLDIGLPAHNYFPVGDVDALAALLGGSLQDFAVDAAAVRARFDWDAIARQTLTVYQESL